MSSINISFKGATLLSVDEAKQIPKNILNFVNGWWWLRSPGYSTIRVATVYDYGCVDEYGHLVDYDNHSVRPALPLNLKSSTQLCDGTNLKIGKYNFTIVCNGKYALCDTSIGKSVFRKDWEVEDANDYEASDVKKVVDEWFETEIKDRIYIDDNTFSISEKAEKFDLIMDWLSDHDDNDSLVADILNAAGISINEAKEYGLSHCIIDDERFAS